MRFLSVAACALAASLLSAGPSQAVWVESHYLTGPHQFTVYGAIPEPIEIGAWMYVDIRQLYPEYYMNNGYQATAGISTQNSYAQFDEVRSSTGYHYPEIFDHTFTISDTDRTIYVGISALYSENWIVNDITVGFSLPDNLSIAAPVPEPSTWAMLILGFAGIALVRRYRPMENKNV